MGGAPPAGAGAACAQQGLGNPGADRGGDGMNGGALAHTLGGYCVAATSGNITACASGLGVPEQVNVQLPRLARATGQAPRCAWHAMAVQTHEDRHLELNVEQLARAVV